MIAKKLVIVQPYIAKYRLTFFVGLIEELRLNGIDCTIAAGVPDEVQRNRGDHVDEPWITPYDNRRLVIGGKTLVIGGARSLWRDADAVIVGLQGTALDTYSAIFDAKRSGMAVGVWGHIKSYVNDENMLDAMLERWQLRNSNHIFAYTKSGAEYALSRGVNESQVTTLMNTVDTSGLESCVSQLVEADVLRASENYGLVSGKVLAYLGGIDASKRIDFLSEVLDEIWERDKEVRLLLGGQGDQMNLMRKGIERGQVIPLGYVGNREKALMGSLAECMLMPGRIGLVAVESLVLNLPIFTTKGALHAPEEEYLVEGVSKFTTDDDVQSYSDSIMFFLSEQYSGEHVVVDNPWIYPRMADMIDNFTSGVVRMLS